MNPKEFELEKQLVTKNKSGLKNGVQQIYVLPPNLLQKLGINLGNVGSAHIHPELDQEKSSKDNVQDNKHVLGSSNNKIFETRSSNIDDGSSNIKTASLMRESVFLSPTFSTTNLNNANNSLLFHNLDVCNSKRISSTESCKAIEDEHFNEKSKETVFSKKPILEEELRNDKIQEKNNLNESYVNEPVESNKRYNGYSSSNQHKVANETKNAINIISEETLTLSKLNEVLQIPLKSSMVPASLNTIIVKNKAICNETITNIENGIHTEKVGEEEKYDFPNKQNTSYDFKTFDSSEHENNLNMSSIVTNKCNVENSNVKITEDVCHRNELNDANYKKELIPTEKNEDFLNPFKVTILNLNNNINITDSNIHDEVLDDSLRLDQDNNPPQNHIDTANTFLTADINIIAQVENNNLDELKAIDVNENIDYNLSENSKTEITGIYDFVKSSDVNDRDKVFNEDQVNIPEPKKCVNDIGMATSPKIDFNISSKEQENMDDVYNFQLISETNSELFHKSEEIVLEKSSNELTPLIEESKSKRKRSLSNAVDDDSNSAQSLTLNPERNILMSKLCIQGVEKPGGEIEEGNNTLTLKTYSNNKRLNIYKNKTFTVNRENVKWTLENNCIDYQESNAFQNLCNLNQFCVCSDFGILEFNLCYDEHIHFLRRRPLDYSLETIFSIYDDDEKIINSEDYSDKYNLRDGSDESDVDRICFNNYDTNHEDNLNQTNISDKWQDIPHSIVYNYENGSNIHNNDSNNVISEPKGACEIIEGKLVESKLVVSLYVEEYASDNINDDPSTITAEENNIIDDTDIKTSFKHEMKEFEMLDDISRKRKISGDICNEVVVNKKVRTVSCDEKIEEIQRENHDTAKHCDMYENNNVRDKNSTNTQNSVNEGIIENTYVKCGVCKVEVITTEWSTHIGSVHDYIAWKDGETPIDLSDENEVRDHLHRVQQELGHLVCSRCGLARKYAKSFLQHIKKCNNSLELDIVTKTVENESVECAVCHQEMKQSQWIEHIAKQHNYLAWKTTERTLDLNDFHQLSEHLTKIVKVVGVLDCAYCGLERRYGRAFAFHVNNCTGNNRILNTTLDESHVSDHEENASLQTNVVCGVCKEEMPRIQWITHIQGQHNYQAWREGEPPLNLDDQSSIREHLYKILKEYGPLICVKCGKARKYVKLYLQHIESCTGPAEPEPNSDGTTTPVKLFSHIMQGNTSANPPSLKNWGVDNSIKDDKATSNFQSSKVKCALCNEESDSTEWIDHIQKQHSYLAWKAGQRPIDLQDEEAIREHLHDVLREAGELVCANCGLVCKKAKMYQKHVTVCIEAAESLGNIINCGVCHKEMKGSQWINHISINHDYVAWKDTEEPLDINNYEAIKQHLMKVIKLVGALKCADCGIKRKYPKSYLLHIKACYGKTYVIEGEEDTLNESGLDTTLETTLVDDESDVTKVVKCGVCSEEMEAKLWITHIEKQHNYLAWQDGSKPLDLENEELIRDHLLNIVRKYGQLTCSKCGLVRRRVLMFYHHAQTCDGSKPAEEAVNIKCEMNSGEIVKCAVCQADVIDSLWFAHIGKEHDYLAWRDGEIPPKLDDDSLLKEHLYKILQQIGELICSKCGITRKYVKSYLQHLRICKGAEQTMVSKERTEVMVKCALCKEEMDSSMWLDHIGKSHNYVAWKENESPLVFEDEASLKDYLYNILQEIGQLVCGQCGLVRKYVKIYLHHIETCQGVTWKRIIRVKKEKGDIVKCAVCHVDVDDTEWIEHIGQEHNYLAWRDRDPELDLNDEESVWNHLKNIVQEIRFLECSKCHVRRKYPKLYLQHVKTCDGTTNSLEENGFNDSDQDDTDGSKNVKCGVCGEEMEKAQWAEHIQKSHRYLAWQEGKESIDVDDKEAVYNHLQKVCYKYNGLICDSCGVFRKNVKTYLYHVKSCSGTIRYNEEDIVECGVCAEKLTAKAWRHHAMQHHYNVAWIAGETPINMRNYNEVDRLLKDYCEYKQKMVCRTCGISRSSTVGFYAHILTCGKTDEEIEPFKDVCDICNQKYLCIYEKQHYAGHKAQEMVKVTKMKAALKRTEGVQDDIDSPSGRRRAAERARGVIENYAAKMSDSIFLKCETCGFESESKKDLAKHYCLKRANKSNDDDFSDSSMKLNGYTTSESDDSEIDSDVSNEDETLEVMRDKSKKRYDMVGGKYASKTSKLPYIVKDVRNYLLESTEDFLEMLHTNETLYPQWQACINEVVTDDLLPQYLPSLEESCKITISREDWTTFKRFEARQEEDYSVIFTGAAIQCAAWAPVRADSQCESVLVVACHRADDCPRFLSTDTAPHPGLLQMWDYGDFRSKPKLAYGLAHDYGTVWAIDWCPSGARDMLDSTTANENVRPRVGLLAMACSNGSAYIVSVPYHSKIDHTSNIPFYKLKPCVELRVSRGTNKYQATSITWSQEKGFTTILVGYGDGTTAMYDLVSESPLLSAKEGDVTILYPFQDERVHNSCVTALTTSILSARCSASATGAAGAAMGGRGGARPVRTYLPLAATSVLFTPHWSSVMLSGDDTIVGHSASELEWGYSGRRLGNVRALAACVRRARLAAFVPPLLQTLRPHPVHSQGHKSLHKKVVAMIDMIPLAKKRSKHTNDELSMKVEPLTYEDAVKSYGLELRFERNLNKALVQKLQWKQREPYPERFPLGDVPVLAYCPAPEHYTKLAVATYAGLLFVIHV